MLRTVVILIVLNLSFCSIEYSFAKRFKAKVIKVIDGDSIQVAKGKEVIEIRLYGIDCPEYNQPFARKSTLFTQTLTLGRSVRVEPVDRDRYGRVVAIVGCGKLIVNEQLIKEGFAWIYPQYCKRRVCREWKKMELKARTRRVGIWAKKQQTPPWVWKTRKK